MRSRALAAALVAALAIILLLPVASEAKTWKKAITCSGRDEQYTDQYDSKPFKLLGGKQKMIATVVPDPELEELDIAEMWSAHWTVHEVDGWEFAYMMMDGEENESLTLTARFKLPKGKYFIDPSSANLIFWQVTIYEWR